LTKENRKALPPLYSQDGKGADATTFVKFFHPTSRYTFFATEFDGEDTLFGFCVSALGPDCDEWGYASLNEFETTVAGPFQMKMERDRHFKPTTVREAAARHGVTL
jgi:hypothetical protein